MTEDRKTNKPLSIKTSLVYAIFALSGASALVYQIIWARWLGLIFGNTTFSVSIVLGCFMMGLTLGSWLAGRFLPRIKNPMLYYAFVELGIGIFALCFPVFAMFEDLLYTALVSSESLTGYSIFIRAILSAAVLIIPTTLMGATLPLLTDFFHHSPKHTQNWKVGFLYAANTLGAAAGIIAASFILIELIGVLATTFAASALNFIVAIIGYSFSQSSSLIRKETISSDEKRIGSLGRFAIALIASSGFLALASEVLWTRTFETMIGNSTYAFATIVLIYLLGIAAGSWIMSLLVNRIKALPVWIATMQLGMGIWVIVSIKVFEYIGDIMVKYSLKMVPIATIFGHYFEAMGILLPLSLLSGACFPLATRIIDPKSEDAKGVLVAKVYAWNTVGALAGSLVAGFIIAPIWDCYNSLFFLASLYFLTAISAYAFIGVSKNEISCRTRNIVVLGSLSVILFVFSFIQVGDKDYFEKRFIADCKESPA